jgi:hypothetical protein
MSVDLLSELASLRQCILTSKDDLNRYRDSHTDACLATVLGSAEQAGIMLKDIAISTCDDNAVLASLLDSCDDSAAAKESIAGVMVAVAAAAANRVCDAANNIAATRINPSLSACADKLEASLDAIGSKAKVIIDEAEARANVVSAARALAKRTYETEWKLIAEAGKMISGFDARIETMSDLISNMCADITVDSDSLGPQVTALNGTQKVVRTQRAATIRKLSEHFGDRKTSDAKTTKDGLVMPSNLESGKGKQLVENIRTHTKAESERFAFCMAELNRVMSDYDPKTQSFYKPVPIPKELHRIDEKARTFYVDDAKALYDDIWAKLPIGVRNRVSTPFNYGFGANKLQGIVTEGDGPTLVFALICIFRSVVGVEEDIIELLTVAHKAFTAANNPMQVVKSLRSKLLEAKDLHIECKWSQTGAKIVEVLCFDNHNMSEGLEDFKDITPLDSQVITTLANLLAAIERQCLKAVKSDNGSKRAHSVNVLDRLGVKDEGNKKGKKNACRDGVDCTRSDCYYSHPDGKKSDGKPVYDSSNTTGGKCEAMGCPETKQKKQLCTSCFFQMLDNGSIKTKSKSMSGGEIRKSDLPERRSKQVSKHGKKARAHAAVIGVKAIQKAWDKSQKRGRDNEDDETIPGKGGPKSAKQAHAISAIDDDDDVDSYTERMADFAKNLTKMGVKLN